MCSGDTVTLNAGVNIQQNGDSVVITYNATQGVSGLTGAAKVYMHSGAELVQFGGWQYTTGNFGQDDGIGKMDSLGNNRWRITIHPQTYYGYPADSSLRGIFMIFRNANGSQTGKNNSNQDIYVAFSTSPPTSAFTGVQVAKKAKGNISYTWSTLATTSSVNILTPGTFIVTATDGTCSKADTITVVQNPTTLINLGNDTTICAGAHLVLNAGTGFTSYHWSTGDSATASIFVSAAASFGVTVTNSSGCVLTGDIGVTLNGKKVELGADIIRCSPTQVIPLNAHKGFLHYEWNGIANQDSVWFASNAGKYWIKCIDSINCLSFDTVSVINSEVHHLSLPDSSLACTGATVALDAATTFTNYGDSITITYDATKGTTGLVGAPKVYMHSGAELHPFGGWQYTTGNFGQDDGVGLMKNLGNNIWTITIQPQGYYGYHPDSTLNGILMIFRNANGTLTGKDGTNQDIFLLTAGGALTSTFNGITASHKHYGTLTYNWSNSSTNGNIGATTGGNYSVTVSDASCSASDTAHVFFGTNPIIHLGNDTIVCGGNQFHLNVDSGYVSYLWSNGASTSTISVATTNNYSVSVTTIFGCVGKDTIHVTALPIPNALFTVQQIGTTNNVTINSTTTTNADSLFWNFGDSNTSDTSGIFVYPYSATNTYTVTLIAVNDCGRDTTTHTITLVPNGISETDLNSISIYPNPAKDKLFINASSISDNAFITINNMLGEEIKTMKWNATSIQSIDVSKFTNGIFILQITDNDKKKTFKFNIIH